MIRKRNGITLIALVITIIILIILSTIAINMTFGDNGLVERAEQAKNMTEEAARKEQEGMANAVAYINEVIYGSSGGGETPSTNEELVVNEEPIINEVESDINSVDTNTVEPPPVDIPDADGNIQFGEVTWSDGQASVSISTSTEYEIEYQKNGTTGNWTEFASGETLEGLNSGDIIYVRLTDGENVGKEISIRIADDVAPEVTVTPGTITSSTIKVEVNAEDNESGMADTVTYTYYIKKSNEEDTAYVNEGSNTNANYTFTQLEQGTSYDIKVEANGDKAGNIGEGTLSGQSTVSIPGGETGLEEGAISFGAPTWSSGTASVIVSTNETGYTIEYQVSAGEPEEENWTEISNNGAISGINHNDTVYARLTDGTNYGDYASTTITDTQGPTVEIVQGEITSNSIAVTVNAVDNETGLATTDTYKYYLNDEAEAKETSTSNTYTYMGLTAETAYEIKVEVTDKAGNRTEKDTMVTTKTSTIADLIGGDKLTETTTINDGQENKVTIPGEFGVAEDSGANVEDGIVIEDTNGNQFVWIPIGVYNTTSGAKTNNLTRRSWGSKNEILNPTEVQGDNGIKVGVSSYYYGEGRGTVYDQMDIEEFKQSANKYKGFYVGRYEQGSGNVSKSGVSVISGSRANAENNANAMYRDNKYVTSALMSSYAWDTTLNFICQNSKEGYMLATTTDNRYGNIEFKGSGSPKAAGQDENDNYCNIHDILGNYSEWTTERPESGNGDWVSRGGNYLRKESTYTSGHDAYAADRSSSFSSGIYEGIGSRVEIYINDTV